MRDKKIGFVIDKTKITIEFKNMKKNNNHLFTCSLTIY